MKKNLLPYLRRASVFIALLIPLSGFCTITDSLTYVLKNTNNSEKKIDVLTELSWQYRRKSADSVIYYADLARKAALRRGLKIKEAAALKNLGIGYDIKGETDSAFHYMTQALTIAEEADDKTLVGRSLNNLGFAHQRRGNYEVALEYYLKSLEISEVTNDLTQGVTLMNIGLLQQKIEDYDNALLHFQRGLQFARQEENTFRIASCLYNIGSVHFIKKRYETARTYFQQAKKYAARNEDDLLSAKILLSAGRVFRAEENQADAERNFREAFALAEKINDTETLAMLYSEFAVNDFRAKKYAAALRHTAKGLALTDVSQAAEVTKNLLEYKAKCQAALGLHAAAYETQNKFIEVSNEIINREKSRKINALQISYSIREQENEVALLKSKQAESEALIEQQNARNSIAVLLILLALCGSGFLFYRNYIQNNQNKILQERVAERTQDLEYLNQNLSETNEELERFAFITSHDLKEPLRNIASFTGLLQRRLRKQEDEETTVYLNFIKKNTHQMHDLIEDVLQYSRIGHQEEYRTQTDTEEVIEDVKASLQTLMKEKNAVVTYTPLPVLTAVRPYLLTIFKNLIENGIKYNESERPEVRIDCREFPAFCEFIVSDNGIGIDPEYGEQIFMMFKRLHNREKYSGSGMGLALVKKVVERAGGSIRVESTAGRGAKFFFTLPKEGVRTEGAAALRQMAN